MSIPHPGIKTCGERSRTMPKGIPRNKPVNQQILHRMKIARGHLDKVIRMTEDGVYCIDIVQQSIAVQGALKKIHEIILKNHMETSEPDSIKKCKSTKELNQVLKF